mgnify:CR=1 FL=1
MCRSWGWWIDLHCHGAVRGVLAAMWKRLGVEQPMRLNPDSYVKPRKTSPVQPEKVAYMLVAAHLHHK